MSTLLSIAEIIELGDASVYLSDIYTSKGQLFGGTVTKPTPPVQIAFVTDALRWGYEGGYGGSAQSDASLRKTANYLYWLCGMFQLQAQRIIAGSGGGSVIPVPPGGLSPVPLDFIVGIGTPLLDGDSSASFPLFIGYDLEFNRGGQPQYTTNPGDGTSYYSWNKVTGVFSCFPAVFDGEPLRLYV